MKRLVAISLKVIVAVIVLIIAYVNVSLYYKPDIETIDAVAINHDVLLQLRHLKNKIDGGAAKEMQQIYPEGFVFLHALYALSWCDFLSDVKPKSSLFGEGMAEVTRSIDRINSEEGRSTFSEYQAIPYGAFYAGWSTYVLGRKLKLSKQDTTGSYLFKLKCKEIAEYIATSSTPYASSYRGMSWPADMVVCIAALKLHDEIFDDSYEGLIRKWVAEVKSKMDEHGLIPHAVDPVTGESFESARGSSQSLMLIFLQNIDPTFAAEQFKIYDSLFITTRFGLTGIREYPAGTWGLGDIDSGPVLFGIGGASSIVGMRTLAAFGSAEPAAEVRNGIEAFGFSNRGGETKSYLFGQLPVADAFITWAHTGMNPTSEVKTSFMFFHAWSILVIALILVFIFKPWQRIRKVAK